MKTVSIIAASAIALAAMSSSAFAQQADNGPSPAARAHLVASTTEHARAIQSGKTRAEVRGEVRANHAQAKVDSLHAHVLRDL